MLTTHRLHTRELYRLRVEQIRLGNSFNFFSQLRFNTCVNMLNVVKFTYFICISELRSAVVNIMRSRLQPMRAARINLWASQPTKERGVW